MEKKHKDFKMFSSDQHDEEEIVQCRVCRKQFPSRRSLFGHMRLHSSSLKLGIYKKRLFVCKDCGKQYLSAKSLYDHQRAYCKSKHNNNLVLGIRLSDESVKLVRKKRSCRRVLRYNIITPANCLSNYSSALNNEIPSSVSEFDPEMEDAAIALLMLSRGEGINWAGFKNVYSDDGNCVRRKKLGIKIFLSEKNIVRCSEFDSRVLQHVDSTIHDLGCESGNVLCIAEKDDENQQPNEKRSRDDLCSDSLDCRSIKRPKLGVCDADLADSFKCKMCYQALGGHQTGHRTTFKTPAFDDKSDFATEVEEADCKYDDQAKLWGITRGLMQTKYVTPI